MKKPLLIINRFYINKISAMYNQMIGCKAYSLTVLHYDKISTLDSKFFSCILNIRRAT